MNTTLPSKRQDFRHLSRIANVRPSDVCEMGDEDGCSGPPAYWLTAPASYVMPLMACEVHGAEEVTAFGTPLFLGRAAQAGPDGEDVYGYDYGGRSIYLDKNGRTYDFLGVTVSGDNLMRQHPEV